MPKKAQQK
uniref:Uncharacterized protein n=1 Tax=Rhizophora mucronata TaxID=61149 RepID=A0A2P2NE52_RHIMU